MPTSRRRCLAVGMGGIARVMTPAIARQPWAELVGIVDVSDESLSRGQELLGLPDDALFRDLDAALATAQADVAIINTPSEWHYRQCVACIDAGLDVLVAKPITNDYDQAVQLVEHAERAGRSLAVGQQVRFNRHYQAVRRFLASGELGTPESVTFLNSKPRHQALNLTTLPQPALYEMSCHHFDTLMALFPDNTPQTITCDGFQPSWSVYAGPCMVNALIRGAGGLHLLYHGVFSSQSDHYELRIEGTAGVLRCRGLHMSKDYMEYEFAARGEKLVRRDDIDAGLENVDAWQVYYDAWRDYLSVGAGGTGSAEPSFSGRNNLKVFALLSAAIESIVSGDRTDVAGSDRYAAAYRHPGEWSV